MPTTQLVLKSTEAGYAALLSAIQAETENHLGYTPAHVILDAAHDANIKVVTAIVPDGARTGGLAAIHPDNLGVGVFLGEFRTLEEWLIAGLPTVGLTGRYARQETTRHAGDGSAVRFQMGDLFPYGAQLKAFVDNVEKAETTDWTREGFDIVFGAAPAAGAKIRIVVSFTEPVTAVRWAREEKKQGTIGGAWATQTYGAANGRTYGDAYAGVHNVEDEIGLPATGLVVMVCGKPIAQNVAFDATNTTLRSGSAAAPNYWYYNYSLDPGTRYGGIVLGGAATDNGDGTFDLTGALRSDASFPFLADPGTAQERELTRAASAAACIATPWSYYAGTYATGQTLKVNLNGADPTNRIMQGAGSAFRPAGGATLQYLRFVGERTICRNPHDSSGPPPINTLYFGQTESWLVAGRATCYGWQFDVKNFTATITTGQYHCENVYFEKLIAKRGRSAVYLIGQGSPNKQFRKFRFGTLEGYDIGGLTADEGHVDGHILGVQNCDDCEVRRFVGRNSGGDINIYTLTLGTNPNLWIGYIDIDGTCEFFASKGGFNDRGLALNGNNDDISDKSNAIIRGARIRNKGTSAILIVWEDQVQLFNPDLDDCPVLLDLTRTYTDLGVDYTGNVKMRGHRMGANCATWVKHATTATEPGEYEHDFDEGVYVGSASDAKFNTTQHGSAQNFSQWQANGAKHDPNSVLEAA